MGRALCGPPPSASESLPSLWGSIVMRGQSREEGRSCLGVCPHCHFFTCCSCAPGCEGGPPAEELVEEGGKVTKENGGSSCLVDVS